MTRSIDAVCLIFSVFNPLATAPQIVQLYSTHDSTGLSLLMWVLYLVGAIPFLAYGWVHRVKPLVVVNVLWVIIDLIMIYGVWHFSR